MGRHSAGNILGPAVVALHQKKKEQRQQGGYGAGYHQWKKTRVFDVQRKIGSLEIVRTRHASGDAVGPEELIPSRFLFGVLPDALLDDFEIWRSTKDPHLLKGYPRAGRPQIHFLNIVVEPIEAGEGEGEQHSDGGAPSLSRCRATITRWPLKLLSEVVCAAVNSSHPDCMQLMRLGAAPRGSVLRRLAHWCARLDTPAQVLAWSDSATQRSELGRISVIHFNRLGVSFVPRAGVDGVVRLHSKDHAGKFVSDRFSDAVKTQMAGLSTSVVLEDAFGQQFLLMPSFLLSQSRVVSKPLSTDLDTSVTDEWKRVMNSRTFLVSVHPSGTFLTCDSLTSSLYLMVYRLMGRNYVAASRLIPSCATDVPYTPDQQMVLRMLAEPYSDLHVDGLACQLRLALLCQESGVGFPLPVPSLYGLYCNRCQHASALCRLSIQEELSLVRSLQGGGVPPSIGRRLEFLKALIPLKLKRDAAIAAEEARRAAGGGEDGNAEMERQQQQQGAEEAKHAEGLNVQPEGNRLSAEVLALIMSGRRDAVEQTSTAQSRHPYKARVNSRTFIEFPEAASITIAFADKCSTGPGDCVTVWVVDEEGEEAKFAGPFQGTTTWPGSHGTKPLVVPHSCCVIKFQSGTSPKGWGWECVATAVAPLQVLAADNATVLKVDLIDGDVDIGPNPEFDVAVGTDSLGAHSTVPLHQFDVECRRHARGMRRHFGRTPGAWGARHRYIRPDPAELQGVRGINQLRQLMKEEDFSVNDKAKLGFFFLCVPACFCVVLCALFVFLLLAPPPLFRRVVLGLVVVVVVVVV